MTLTIDRPWVEFDLGGDMQVLSWAINRPGLVQARRILWREVRNADLSPELDVVDWLDRELGLLHARDAVCFLTSRDVEAVTQATAQIGSVCAHAVATVGLSNAERVGTRFTRAPGTWGTINVAVRLDIGLTETALLEAVSIATQARTAAVMDLGLDLPTGRATGTGTDCIAVAAATGTQAYAGLHTEVGHALGQAVYDAVWQGAQDWKSSPGAEAAGLSFTSAH